MFGKTKKPDYYTQQAVIASFACSVDELEKYECSTDALGSCMVTILKTMGHSEEEALTASLMTTKALENEFPKMYWADRTFSHKVSVLVAIIETARNSLKNGVIDERTKSIVKLAMEDVKNDADKKNN